MNNLQEQKHQSQAQEDGGTGGTGGTYLWTLTVLQNVSVRFFGGKEASAASVQVLKDKKDG